MSNASTAQTFAIFCALKIDVRACNLSRDAAHEILTKANAGHDSKVAVYAETAKLPGSIEKGIRPTFHSLPVKKICAVDKRDFANVWDKAWKAGQAAAAACVPVPMHVVQHANPLDDSSPVVHRYAPVTDGVCGFASVKFAGNTAFGKWAKKQGLARPAYQGGLSVWIGDYNQSLQKKEAHAYAMAAELEKHGITAHGESRMD